jgi:hypothetical protein
VAERFTVAVFRGEVGAAVALLVHPVDPTLSARVATIAMPWKRRHATVRLPGSHRGEHWRFSFAGTHTHPDGRFERVRGDFDVVVVPSENRAAVEFFGFLDETTQYGSHHDSVLMPSNR